MGLKDRLRKLESAADRDLLTFELEDGTVVRFAPDTFEECLLHEVERGRKYYEGEDPGPAVALKRTAI